MGHYSNLHIAAELWESSPIFKLFREPSFLKDSDCSGCKSLDTCLGGCRAKSMTFSGDFNSVDPWMCAFYNGGKQ